jgi:hypothetical protein
MCFLLEVRARRNDTDEQQGGLTIGGERRGGLRKGRHENDGIWGQQESDRNRRNRLTSEGRSPVTHCAWTRDGTFMESGLSLQRPESFEARKSKTASGRNIQR